MSETDQDMRTTDSDKVRELKTLAIQGLFSDDELMDILVLKGGNALDIIHKMGARASIDLDFSIPDQFPGERLAEIQAKIDRGLQRVFTPAGYHVFDVRLQEKPKHLSPEMAPFWGGYGLEFKVIRYDLVASIEREVDQRATKKQQRLDEAQRREKILHLSQTSAEKVGKDGKARIEIDISKYEYCEPKVMYDVGGFTVYAYSPGMIVCEKIRAICQQTEEYTKLVKSHRSSRARDFYDIYRAVEMFKIDVASDENQDILRRMFEVKRVPLSLLGKISDEREFHRLDFPSVIDTIPADQTIHEFDVYFDFVLEQADKLKSLWNEQAPI